MLETFWKILENLTQVFHSYRINLSPFTKDFRVWETPIETLTISLRLPSGSWQLLLLLLKIIFFPKKIYKKLTLRFWFLLPPLTSLWLRLWIRCHVIIISYWLFGPYFFIDTIKFFRFWTIYIEPVKKRNNFFIFLLHPFHDFSNYSVLICLGFNVYSYVYD